MPLLRHILLIVVLSLCAAGQLGFAMSPDHRHGRARAVKAQVSVVEDDDPALAPPPGAKPVDDPGNGMRKVFRGKYHTVTPEGDTVLVVIFNEITVFPPLKFKNKKMEEFYWRTVRDVKRTLPYAKLICQTLLETYEYIETFPTQKEREQYLKEMEGAVFEQYKPILKRFSKNQARMLVKLIQRETNQSGYDILKAFLGSFRATFWQGFGRLFGVNLKGKYQPDRDEKDAIIERVCVLVEQGQL